MTFDQLQLDPPLLKAVKEAGYQTPSPIQEKAIPPVLSGRDLLACAQTGTGKTAAFALPILQRLSHQPRPQGKRPIKVLVLTPTRELALQIQENFEQYATHLPLRSTVIFGGVGQAPQVKQLVRGVDILVATPGRLNDLIGQGYIKLGDLQVFVLDEADRMLDMGFVQDVKKVIKQLPKKRQNLLFSATMPPEIVSLADGILQNPAKVFVTPTATTVEKIDQKLYKVDKANKRHLLAKLLRDDGVQSALVFTRTKHGADRVARDLKREGIAAMAIHGNKSQTARQTALARFKEGKMGVLVATDIAARGLDISELSHVFNYDLPNIPETYVHRIGRTGRAGRGGDAISFCSSDELPYLADIEKLIGFKIPEEKHHPWPMLVLEPAVPEKPAKRGRGAQSARPPKAEKQPAPKVAEKRGRAKTGAARPGQRGEKSTTGATPAKADASKAAPAQNGKQGAAKRQAQSDTQIKPGAQKPKAPQGGKAGGPRKPRGPMPDDYDTRTGGKAIITKRPVWATPGADDGGAEKQGEDDMSRNNRRRRGGKNRAEKQNGQAPQQAEAQNQPQNGADNQRQNAPNRGGQRQGGQRQNRDNKREQKAKNPNGLFDFSEEELAKDDSIRLISETPVSSEAKYSSFEDYLKDH